MARKIRIYNPKKEIYGEEIYGAPRIADVVTEVDLHYSVHHQAKAVEISTHYKINARYKASTPTIEDIYSYATNRFMKLGCLDGPIFPFYDKGDDN